MKRLHYLLLSIISLATGIMVYILFHPVPLAFDLIPWIKSFPSIQIHSPIIKQFTQCYAADLFWAVSFAFIILFFSCATNKTISDNRETESINSSAETGQKDSLSENQQKVLSENGWVITPATTLKNYYPNDYDADSAGYPSD